MPHINFLTRVNAVFPQNDPNLQVIRAVAFRIDSEGGGDAQVVQNPRLLQNALLLISNTYRGVANYPKILLLQQMRIALEPRPVIDEDSGGEGGGIPHKMNYGKSFNI